MKVHLVSGYKGSGKDTFYTFLKEQNFFDGKVFYIYGNPHNPDIKDYYTLLHSIKNPARVALSDPVKQETNSLLKIRLLHPKLAELAKEHLLLFDQHRQDYRTLRSYYVEYATQMRRRDQDYWCKKLHSELRYIDTEDIVITDWRFPNEKKYFEKHFSCLTYRVFRSEAIDRDLGDESEHSLDTEVADYLVLSNPADFAIAKALLPQYKDYVRI